MVVDLHTGDPSLPYQFLPDNQGEHLPPRSHDHNHFNINRSSAIKPQLLIPHEFGSHTNTSSLAQGKHKDDDFVAHFTHHMAPFMLQDDHKLESSWDSTGLPQSTLWSPLGLNQGSSEGSSQEPSPPAASGNNHESCWESTHDVVTMFEEMQLDGKGNSKYHHGSGTRSLKTSNVRPCSYQPLTQEQIRASQLSRLKQEQILSLQQKLIACRESHGLIYESNEQLLQSQKKGKGVAAVGSGNGWRTCPTRPGPLPQQARSEMRSLFLGGSDSTGASCGTGVFLPPGGTSAPSESCSSKKRPGKGCSSVLIPARVVQALQLHFDQVAATSGPKAAGFPPLHDVLVSNNDGMYSLQKRQSRKAPATIQDEMILPQEWTY